MVWTHCFIDSFQRSLLRNPQLFSKCLRKSLNWSENSGSWKETCCYIVTDTPYLVKRRYIMKNVQANPNMRNEATHCITASVCNRLSVGMNRGANSTPNIFILWSGDLTSRSTDQTCNKLYYVFHSLEGLPWSGVRTTYRCVKFIFSLRIKWPHIHQAKSMSSINCSYVLYIYGTFSKFATHSITLVGPYSITQHWICNA